MVTTRTQDYKVGICYHRLCQWLFAKSHVLQASTNNKTNTVFSLFMEPVEKFGFPQRVRGDQRLKNVEVVWIMFSNPSRGPRRGCFIAGKRCHSQRIERFWRDLFHRCTFIFYYVFWYLEESGHLDISNETHLFCLHYVFLPRINRHLTLFQEGYENRV